MELTVDTQLAYFDSYTCTFYFFNISYFCILYLYIEQGNSLYNTILPLAIHTYSSVSGAIYADTMIYSGLITTVLMYVSSTDKDIHLNRPVNVVVLFLYRRTDVHSSPSLISQFDIFCGHSILHQEWETTCIQKASHGGSQVLENNSESTKEQLIDIYREHHVNNANLK